MNIAIVEDNFIQRELLEMYVLKLGMNVVGLYDSGEGLLKEVSEVNPDIVLMDINLKGLKNGIDTTKEIVKSHALKVIYTTAQTEHSVLDKAADSEPMDILIKPFSIEQLHASLLLARHKSTKSGGEGSSKYIVKNDFLVYKDGHMYERLPITDLIYAEGDGNYFNLHFKNKKATLKGTLSEFELNLPTAQFCRVNRSIILAISSVTSFNNRRVIIASGEEFTLSKSHAEEVMAKLMGV